MQFTVCKFQRVSFTSCIYIKHIICADVPKLAIFELEVIIIRIIETEIPIVFCQ